jgi:hypothetical protein
MPAKPPWPRDPTTSRSAPRQLDQHLGGISVLRRVPHVDRWFPGVKLSGEPLEQVYGVSRGLTLVPSGAATRTAAALATTAHARP